MRRRVRSGGLAILGASLLGCASLGLLVLPQTSASAKTSATGGISADVRAELLETARFAAIARGDSQPHDIEAVRTTVEGAERLGDGRGPSTDGAAPVYVIAMRGLFNVECPPTPAPRGAGRPCPPPRVLVLEVLAENLEHGVAHGASTYPHLLALGAPVRLAPVRAPRKKTGKTSKPSAKASITANVHAELPAVSYAAGAAELHQSRCPAQTPKCATLIIKVYALGGIRNAPKGGTPSEYARLLINKLGPEGDVQSTTFTRDHKLRVAPGRYGIADVEGLEGGGPGTRVFASKKVSASADQTVEVTLRFQAK